MADMELSPEATMKQHPFYVIICLEAIGKQLEKDFVIALPARDMLLIANADDEDMINKMRDVAADIYQN